MSEIALPGNVSLAAPRVKGRWIESAGFDLLLLIFAPLVTIPVLAGLYFKVPWLAIGGGLVLAFSHYSSTLSFFFWNESREYHRRRWIAFVVGPILIAATYLLILGLKIPYLIQFVLFFWNTFHVARQNSGILAIYRHGAGVTDIAQRNAAHRAILAVSLFLSVWNIETHKEVAALFAATAPSLDLATMVRFGTGAVALIALIQLAFALRSRFAAGTGMGAPELLFLCASIGFFYPYLFINNSEMATFAMLLPHYVQYMSLVWLLHRRKFGSAAATDAPPAPAPLRVLSRRVEVLIPVLFAVGLGFYLLHETAISVNRLALFETLYLLIAFEHFYLDGLIWSFKQPHVRKTIAPFLLRRAA